MARSSISGGALALANTLLPVIVAVPLLAALPVTARAEDPSPLATLKALRLQTTEVGRSYFAYAYVRTHDSEWAEAGRKEWLEFLRGYTPDVLSLDWGFIRELPPEERARTYAWYQILLNAWVYDVYEERGLDFLRAARNRLPWKDSDTWTTELLLPALEEIAPGFEARADGLQRGNYLRDLSSIDEEH